MEEKLEPPILEGEIVGIRFGLATHKEICTASISECPISHSSQLTNPFLGLPLEFGKCESCGASEVGQCEGHFGYMELPIPIYHPSHVAELKRLLSLLCLKCLKMKRNKVQMKPSGIAERMLSCCEEASQVSIRDYQTTDGVWLLQLKVPSRLKLTDDLWNFLEKYGFRYGHGHSRTLLPCEVMEMLKRISEDTRKKLSKKGYFPQDGYILRFLPVPPNCLSVPDISDGVNIMAADLSTTVLKKILKQIETIKSSRSGPPNFQSHQVEVVDLQSAVDQYLQIRGMTKSSREADGARFGVRNESSESATKTWLEKMKTLFLKKGSGFSSRTVIAGDAYTEVSQIGIPLEIAQRITFEERVNDHNISHLQELVDNKLCLTYRDGSSRFSLRESSKGHTSLRVGQFVYRRIVDGDIVFVNRPPTTHKHALQALSVYVHDDHIVKINPLICGPLSADFDGDCIHLFYPQSVAAKAEALELFALEKQLLSSHSGNLILQLSADSVLSLKAMLKSYFYDRAAAQQLAMFLSYSLSSPSLFKAKQHGPYWTALQILQSSLPASFECSEDMYLISKSNILKVDHDRDVLQNILNEVATSIFFQKGPEAVILFFNSVQPLLMENLYSKGFSISLEDFSLSENIRKNIQRHFEVMARIRSTATYNERVELQIENCIQKVKQPVVDFILESSALADLIHSKSDSGVKKVVEQIGFLGLQISDLGKLYSKVLVEDAASLFVSKYPSDVEYPSAQYGLVKGCFFRGLDPYEEMIHSISSREVMIRSSRGLSEPGTLFKNLMAVLRDVVICYDDTVRNVCSNLIIQFQYGEAAGTKFQSSLAAGEPVGVLAATAMSNPAYKAVLDSSPNSNSSWELMKEILLCRVGFKNNQNDRRVILYLNECGCGRKYCQEKAAYLVKNHLEKVSLKDTATSFMIEYTRQPNDFRIDSGLVGHIHLTKRKLQSLKIGMHDVLQKCQHTINLLGKSKKELGKLYKMTTLSVSECCSFPQSCKDESLETPCLMFCLGETYDGNLEKTMELLAERICPVLMETIVKGDERVSSANIIWASPDTTSWIRNPSRTKEKEGEVALDIVLEKKAVKQSGDAWRTVLDACLPVIHLIDTTRSVPYAIKQVQGLLGISCAFDQAVQRLSTSVTMVAKGLLKEHLFLLANSMTCSGNLVGFNPAGIKALSRSLDIQAPFTEATLYTPKKCFERAAEKRHVDPLSSIVASCSWGKPVAVGTGSRFDILWDIKESSFSQNESMDIYGFLNMVRTTKIGEEAIPGSLGFEVDDLIPEDDDWNMSPERESGIEKPTFEDSAELCIADNADSSWDIGAGKEQGTTVWGAAEESGWDLKASMTNDQKESDEQQPWSSWGAATTKKQEESCKSDWDTKVTSGALEVPGGWGAAGSRTQAESEKSTWDKPAEKSTWDKPAEKSTWDKPAEKSTWDKSAEKSTWDKPAEKSTWATEKEPEKSSWNDTAAWQSSGENKAVNCGSDWTAKPKVREEHDQHQSWSGWKSAAPRSQDESGQPSGNGTAAWQKNRKPESDKPGSDWSVEALNEPNKHQPSSRWGAATKENAWSKEDNGGVIQDERSHGWGSQKPAGGSDGWGVQSTGGDYGSDGSQQHGWGSQKPAGGSDRWGVQSTGDDNGSDGSQQHGWGSPKPAAGSDGWGGRQKNGDFKKNRPEGSRGWGNNPDWKPRKNFPPKSPGMGREESGSGGMGFMYTATRHRMDLFSTEEQGILAVVEPLMLDIRRIMHNAGYNDGDRLSADDQKYIVDNVFNYHPDKVAKTGAGMDYITINKHTDFKDTRCLYIVSTDGSRQDFSYRKCLENLIKEKYPDLAEEFNSKYFAKRTGGNNNRPPPKPESPSILGSIPETPPGGGEEQ